MVSFRLLVMIAGFLCSYTAKPYSETGRFLLPWQDAPSQNSSMISTRSKMMSNWDDVTSFQGSPSHLELQNSGTPTAFVFDLVKRERRSTYRRECRPETGVYHRQAQTASYFLRLKGDHALYLTFTPANAPSSLSASRLNGRDSARCFRFHSFTPRTLCQSSGDLVMLETEDRGRFFSSTSNNRITITSGLSATSTTQIDSRFFRIYREPGEVHDRIKHLASGSFLSATADRVVLGNATSNVFPEDMLFEKFPCTS